MMMPLERPARWSRTDLMVAVIALFFLLAARPVLAQSNLNPTAPANATQNSTTPSNTLTNGTTAPGGSLNPAMPATQTATQSASQTTNPQGQPYLNPAPVLNPGASQTQREAAARQNGFNGANPRLQPLPECRVEDSACIEQRNRMNQNNPQTAPAFNR